MNVELKEGDKAWWQGQRPDPHDIPVIILGMNGAGTRYTFYVEASGPHGRELSAKPAQLRRRGPARQATGRCMTCGERREQADAQECNACLRARHGLGHSR